MRCVSVLSQGCICRWNVRLLGQMGLGFSVYDCFYCLWLGCHVVVLLLFMNVFT